MFTLPNYLYEILSWICDVLIILVFANLLFFTTLSFFGLKKPKRDYKLVSPQKKFLFLVPAHNEASVIKETVKALLNQDYDDALFDIVVIADNCTDDTANIVRNLASKAIVFENFSKPDEPRGKPHGIASFINQGGWESYDYIAFIDADNIVVPSYLTEMNSQSVAHPDFVVIQGYLGMKNISTSITASGYAAVYFITNRAVQAANYALGWNAAIGGTGFILDTTYLKENGWNPRSYTEDFELQVELSMKGLRSGWNHFASVLDEKPNGFKVSHNQRVRWAQGHWFVAFTTTIKQVVSLFKSRTLRELMSKIETLFYSYSMVRPISYLGILCLSVLDSRLFNYLPMLFSTLLFWGVMQIVNFLIIPTVYFLQEAKPYFNMKKSLSKKIVFFFRLIYSFIYNSLTYMLAQIVGFGTWFFPQNKWNKTVHSVQYEDLEGE